MQGDSKDPILSGLLTMLIFCSLLTFPAVADIREQHAISHQLTTLFRSARQVISFNQTLINDETLGNKGLTAEILVEQIKANYRTATSEPLNEEHEAVIAMQAAITDTINRNQSLINQKGQSYKGFLPAVFARQVASRFTEIMDGKMQIKLTAPKSFIRNLTNAPDRWEHHIIEAFFKSKDYAIGKPFSEITKIRGKVAFRYILPEYYDQSCLECHGGPKGEPDPTGGYKEGGSLNDLGGAISLIIFENQLSHPE
mgnify:CR=1 FL=1